MEIDCDHIQKGTNKRQVITNVIKTEQKLPRESTVHLDSNRDSKVKTHCTAKQTAPPSQRSNEKNKKSTPKIRELFSLFKV